ncbi:hypothetical protein [Robertmurraya kyonggiensis]|uniref:Uncharacterized protein n=1 Tax=Robertmurraya kyonggiensis TaxID=1037680 RepID=A0A4U1D5D8_9BACI|nr:hypothetical protein [Robertmurraya kyonggiensis]TKC17008.1 hypothetical protein FA727_13195 [Robertmurraya kyonggiensis]
MFSNRKKTLLIFFIAFIILSSVCYFFIHSTLVSKKGIDLFYKNDEIVHIALEGYILEQVDVNEKNNLRSIDTTYEIEIKKFLNEIGRIRMTVREIDNGDYFIFSSLENFSKKPLKVDIEMPFDELNRFSINDFEQFPVNHQHDKVFGVDPTTYPIGLISLYDTDQLKKSMVISRNYVSKKMIQNYNDGTESVIRKLESENKGFDLSTDNKGVYLNMPLYSTGKDISENWVMLSEQPLFKNEDALNDWIERSNTQYRYVNKWYTSEGSYSKLPWSIEPGEKLGYGRNLSMMQDDPALEHYNSTKERYFYNLIINSVNNLMNFQDKEERLWRTEYTSTWLKSEYGIQAPYTDTRHNEKVSVFLKDISNTLGIKELKDVNLVYADFLVSQVGIGNIIDIDEGYLITDYYSPTQKKPTHVSLNHALGEMYFLIDAYKQTN